MFTIDASVHLNAINPHEANSLESKTFLEYLKLNSLPVFSPTLLLVELASSLARLLDNHSKGIELAMRVRYLPDQNWIPLDPAFAEHASRIGAEQRLRGADAVYVAVAQRYQTILVTLDKQQIDRLSSILPVRRPAEALREFKSVE
jgi:predicted nucleic acid-binding protein